MYCIAHVDFSCFYINCLDVDSSVSHFAMYSLLHPVIELCRYSIVGQYAADFQVSS